jgi:hypothetical protein
MIFLLKLRKRGIFIFASVLPLLEPITMQQVHVASSYGGGSLLISVNWGGDVMTLIIINPSIKDWSLPGTDEL